jgi:Bacterial mobilisation protein (MobC)
MSESTHLMTWLPRDTKAQFAALAHHQGVSESALLKRLVVASLAPTTVVKPQAPDVVEPVSATGRLSIRLRSDDLLILRERAKAREMPTSTYVSLLIRSHLRALAPLPTPELHALKRSVAEIGAIGRNLNQIARAVNQGEPPGGPSKADLHALLRALDGLRLRVKALINTNLESWRSGYEKANH